jgi:hypothetical protein
MLVRWITILPQSVVHSDAELRANRPIDAGVVPDRAHDAAAYPARPFASVLDRGRAQTAAAEIPVADPGEGRSGG